MIRHRIKKPGNLEDFTKYLNQSLFGVVKLMNILLNQSIK